MNSPSYSSLNQESSTDRTWDNSNIQQLVLQQSQQIQQLQQNLLTRDEELSALLAQVQGLHVRSSNQPSGSNRPYLGSKARESFPKRIPSTATPKKKIVSREQDGKYKGGKRTPQRAVSEPISSPKRNPNQLIMSETPEGFKPTKEAFFVHIKVLWGLVFQNSVPVAPDQNFLKEFNQRFSQVSEIKNAAEVETSAALIPQADIITLRGAKTGRKKVGRGIVNLKEFYILYIQATLSRLGIRRWAPDLEGSDDSLYNEACRISAIQTFRQIASAGAYEYMNVSPRFLNNIALLVGSYNHYVHWIMAQRFQKESKELGKHQKDEEKKVILRARQRLCDSRYKFGVAQNFPKRYLKILLNIDSHSDDEYSAKKNCYYIKTLKFRSSSASMFMRRVDQEIEKADAINGKRSQRQKRVNPKSVRDSICVRVPKGLPIDFYDAEWFNDCSAAQKTVIADTYNVAFLPDASKSIRGKQHPDEKLSDKKFSEKYWDQATVAYDLSHEITKEDDVDDETDDDLGDEKSIDLANTSDEEEDEDNDSYEEEDNDDEDEDDEDDNNDSNPRNDDTEMAHVEDPTCYKVDVNEWSGW